MAGRVQIRPVHDGDAEYLAVHMRKADREEIWASGGRRPLEAIRRGLRLSTDTFVAERDGELACIWGFAPISLATGQAAPWMLGTDLMFRLGRSLSRVAMASFEYVAPVYPRLMNYVDARNTRSVAWLKSVGFTVHDPEPHGVAGLPFHRFEMEAAYV